MNTTSTTIADAASLPGLMEPRPIWARAARVRRQIGGLAHALMLGTLRLKFLLLCRAMPVQAASAALRLFCTPRNRASAKSRNATFRAAERVTLHGPEGRLAVYRWPSITPPTRRVLLVHGWSGAVLQFEALVRALIDTGCEVVSFDQPGHGNSPGRQASLPDFIDAYERVRAACGPFDTTIGHSLGAAAVAASLSRNAWGCERVVLMAAPADIVGVTRRFANLLWIAEPVRRQLQAALEAKYGGRPLASYGADMYASKVTPSVLIVHDRNDPEVPFTDAECFERCLPNARLFATAGLGHRRLLQDLATLSAIVDFLTAED